MQFYSRLIPEIVFSLVQLKNEIPLVRSKAMVYFPDFNYLYPYIYTQRKDRYHFTDLFGRSLFQLNEQFDRHGNIHICISLPTVIELLYSLQRHYDFFHKHQTNSALSEYAFQCIEELEAGQISMMDIKSDLIRNFLITEQHLDSATGKMRNFMACIRNHRIDMLTDHYSPAAINRIILENQEIYDDIENRMSHRSREDSRSDISKLISYKADTHNTILPLLNTRFNDREINFICSNRFQDWAPTINLKEHQRSPLFLMMMLGHYALTDSQYSSDQRLDQVDRLVDRGIDEGQEFMSICEKGGIIELDTRKKMEAFCHEHLTSLIEMESDARNNSSDLGKRAGERPSYKQYIDSIERKKASTVRTMQTMHGLIDESRDDMYRDFVDNARIRKALGALKLG